MNAVPDAASDMSLADFSRDHRPPHAELSSRVTSLVLTASLAGLLILFAAHRSLWSEPEQPAPAELEAQLVPAPRKIVIPPPPPHFTAHLIRPHMEAPAPPVFTVASETLPAPALLPASAAKTSPIAGGVPAGQGSGAQGVSANGTDGNGTGLSGCWDRAWAQAITDRVRHFFYYPKRARDQHVTGMVLVHMGITRYGRLFLEQIDKSSGDEALDTAAYNMVHNAQPLPWIPEKMHVDRAEGVLPIVFGPPDKGLQATDSTCAR